MRSIEKVVYAAKVHTAGGRDCGWSRTSDGRLDVKFSVPGDPGTGTNPEQLFAVGWSACYRSAFKIVAGRMKVRLPPDIAIDPEVDLGHERWRLPDSGEIQRRPAGYRARRCPELGGGRAPGVSLFKSHPRHHQRCDKRD